MSYEKLSDKIVKISEANVDRFYKNGKIDSKLATVLGTERLEIIDDILKQAK